MLSQREMEQGLGDKSFYDYQVKMLVVGEMGIGKSQIVNRFMGQQFDASAKRTFISAVFNREIIFNDGKVCKVTIRDMSGNPEYSQLTQTFYHDACASVVVYDVTKPDDFVAKLNESLDALARHCALANGEGVDCRLPLKVYLVGNKSDLSSAEKVSESQVKELIDKKNDEFCKLKKHICIQDAGRWSAKEDHQDIQKLFERMISEICADLTPLTKESLSDDSYSEESSSENSTSEDSSSEDSESSEDEASDSEETSKPKLTKTGVISLYLFTALIVAVAIGVAMIGLPSMIMMGIGFSMIGVGIALVATKDLMLLIRQSNFSENENTPVVPNQPSSSTTAELQKRNPELLSSSSTVPPSLGESESKPFESVGGFFSTLFACSRAGASLNTEESSPPSPPRIDL